MIDRVKCSTAGEPTPLVAVMAKVELPTALSPGVPLTSAVPSPWSTKLRPDGGDGATLRLGVG